MNCEPGPPVGALPSSREGEPGLGCSWTSSVREGLRGKERDRQTLPSARQAGRLTAGGPGDHTSDSQADPQQDRQTGHAWPDGLEA